MLQTDVVDLPYNPMCMLSLWTFEGRGIRSNQNVRYLECGEADIATPLNLPHPTQKLEKGMAKIP